MHQAAAEQAAITALAHVDANPGLVTLGFANAASFEFLQRTAKMFATSDMVPAKYRAVIEKGYGNNITYEQNPAGLANCVIALDMATRMNANPLMIMQNLHVIEGRPSWSSQFIIAVINNCGRYSPLRFDLEWIDEIEATYSTFDWQDGPGGNRNKVERKHSVKLRNARCVAWVLERETGTRLESPPVTMEMAVNEGWYGKNGSKWRSMPELMMRYRAAAFFGRFYAPELLMGLPTVEETLDIIDVERQPDGKYAMPETPTEQKDALAKAAAAEAATRAPRAPRKKNDVADASNVKEEVASAAANADSSTEQKTGNDPGAGATAAQIDPFEPLQESQLAFIRTKMEHMELGDSDFKRTFGKKLEDMAADQFQRIVRWISNPTAPLSPA